MMTREAAGAFFMEGMSRAIHRLAEQAHPAFPGRDLLRLQTIGERR